MLNPISLLASVPGHYKLLAAVIAFAVWSGACYHAGGKSAAGECAENNLAAVQRAIAQAEERARQDLEIASAAVKEKIVYRTRIKTIREASHNVETKCSYSAGDPLVGLYRGVHTETGSPPSR